MPRIDIGTLQSALYEGENDVDIYAFFNFAGCDLIENLGDGEWHFYYGNRPWQVHYIYNTNDANDAMNSVESRLHYG